MAGYQGTLSPDPFDKPKHDALAGSEYMPGGLPSENPEKDDALQTKIMESLEAHVEIDASGIQVAVKNGFISLTGIARNDDNKATIEALVESTDGVRDVASLIEVDSISDLFRSMSGNDDFMIQDKN
ncbi:MAG TPA: BON domain-containing protein [Bacteriovoracaceae bacterium]|nr:BON domain-containing protein [Bacteriovoracaceae bacterium]